MRTRAAWGLLLVVLGAWAALAQGLPPAPTRWVTDEAGVLSEPVERQLNARLRAYEQETGHQVLVWIGQSTQGQPLEEWAARTFAAWGVGRKELDDGLVVFLLMGDRRIRVEVGYGLEPVVTDAQASRLIRDVAVPALKAGNVDQAVQGMVDGVLGIIGGEHGAAPQPLPRESAVPAWVGWLFIALFGGFTLLVVLLVSKLTKGSWKRGGPWAGGGYYGGSGSSGSSGSSGGGGYSGGGGSSGGGGASGSW